MKKFIICFLIFGFTSQGFSQITKTEQLSEVVIVATNYKYLNQVGQEEVAIPVKNLQRKVASYDIKYLDIYSDEYDYYSVSFYIPEGKILAAYDKDGKILYTIEKFNNVALPNNVASSVAERFPKWKIAKDVYKVNYDVDSGTKKQYKIVLENGKKRIRIKVDDDGVFL